MPDMLFILLLAVVIFGPRKLPELARQLGKYLAQFRQMKREFTDQIESEISKISAAEEMENAGSGTVASAAQTVTSRPT